MGCSGSGSETSREAAYVDSHDPGGKRGCRGVLSPKPQGDFGPARIEIQAGSAALNVRMRNPRSVLGACKGLGGR